MAKHSHGLHRDHAEHGSHKQHTHDGHSDHSGGHSHKHAHMADVKKTLADKARRIPGLIYLERQIHDGAIVISATLTCLFTGSGMSAYIKRELENAAQEIEGIGGIVGHIKASVLTSSTCTISVAEEKASEIESALKSCRIRLAAIVFLVDDREAESIIRKALSVIRSRAKETNQ